MDFKLVALLTFRYLWPDLDYSDLTYPVFESIEKFIEESFRKTKVCKLNATNTKFQKTLENYPKLRLTSNAQVTITENGFIYYTPDVDEVPETVIYKSSFNHFI